MRGTLPARGIASLSLGLVSDSGDRQIRKKLLFTVTIDSALALVALVPFL